MTHTKGHLADVYCYAYNELKAITTEMSKLEQMVDLCTEADEARQIDPLPQKFYEQAERRFDQLCRKRECILRRLELLNKNG